MEKEQDVANATLDALDTENLNYMNRINNLELDTQLKNQTINGLHDSSMR